MNRDVLNLNAIDKVDIITLDFYDRMICGYIVNKYGLPEKQALKRFLFSET